MPAPLNQPHDYTSVSIHLRGACAALPLLLAACGPAAPEPPPAPEFDAERARIYLVTQVNHGPRVPGHAPHRRQLQWMTGLLRVLADTVESQPFRATGGSARERDYANVVARWRPELRERVLIATHFDTHLFAHRDPDPSRHVYPVPGANEGASGPAVLMELAQGFKRQPPPVGVDLVFLDGAFGRDSSVADLGAREFVAAMGGEKPRWALYVDRVGDLDPEIPREPGSAPALQDRLREMARLLGRDTVWTEAAGPAMPGAHHLFAAAGIPAAAVIDPSFGPGNRFWRTRSDVPQNTGTAGLAAVGEVLAAMVYGEAAEAP